MSNLFGRRIDLSIAAATDSPGATGFNLSNIDCTFRVKKTLKEEPNTCTLHLYNLAKDTRSTLEMAKHRIVRLAAGYTSGTFVLYKGELRSAHTRRDGADLVTELESGDSERQMATARASFPVGPQETLDKTVGKVIDSMGVGKGNFAQAAARMKARAKAIFGKGTVVHGNAAKALTNLCKSSGMQWSVQDGNVQILDIKPAKPSILTVLSSDSGLIDSPTIDHKGVVELTALLQPGLTPGEWVRLEAESFGGDMLITDAEYMGDTSGNEWFARLHCKVP